MKWNILKFPQGSPLNLKWEWNEWSNDGGGALQIIFHQLICPAPAFPTFRRAIRMSLGSFDSLSPLFWF